MMSLLYFCSIWLFATLVSSQFDDTSGIPACASTCSSTAFSEIGCVASANTITEWTCVCEPGNGFFVRAVPCFSLNCTTAAFQSTSDWFTQMCATVNVIPPPFQSVLDGPPPPPPGAPPPPGIPPPPGAPPPPRVNVTITLSTATLYATPSSTLLTQIIPITTSTPSTSSSTSIGALSATSSPVTSPVADNGKKSSITSASIAGISIGGVLACSAIIFGGFMLYRREKRRNPNAQINGSKQNFPFGEEDIDLVPPKGSALRYPDIEGQECSANLGSDETEFPRSPFEPKFTPAIISISG